MCEHIVVSYIVLKKKEAIPISPIDFPINGISTDFHSLWIRSSGFSLMKPTVLTFHTHPIISANRQKITKRCKAIWSSHDEWPHRITLNVFKWNLCNLKLCISHYTLWYISTISRITTTTLVVAPNYGSHNDSLTLRSEIFSVWKWQTQPKWLETDRFLLITFIFYLLFSSKIVFLWTFLFEF